MRRLFRWLVPDAALRLPDPWRLKNGLMRVVVTIDGRVLAEATANEHR